MLRKTVSFLITLCMFSLSLLPVSAQAVSRIVDEASLLLSEELTVLNEKAEQFEDQYGIYAVVLTVDSLNGNRIQDYADDYYDSAGFGDNGVLFLLAMAEREWYISTSGTLIYALTDYGIQQLGEGIIPYLTDERWYDGFCYYLDSLPYYLGAFENGTPIDGFADYSADYSHADREEVVYYEEESSPSFLFSLLLGIVIAGIAVFVMRLSMNTKQPQRSASFYMIDGTWNLTHRADMFLYSNVTKTRKQEPAKNSGGGSSVHRSSSGRKHGGGGGKF